MPGALLGALAQRYGQKAADAVVSVISMSDTLAEFTSAGRETFLSDTKTQWAAEMGLIRIGEMVNRLPPEFLQAYPDQPWRQIVDMRNFAAHQYDDLEPNRVWRTLTRDVASLRTYLHAVVLDASTQTDTSKPPSASSPEEES